MLSTTKSVAFSSVSRTDGVDVLTGSNANQVSLHCGNLPNDVLCAIFKVCADLDPPHQSYSTGVIVHHLGWITLGHVNRRWRMLLLSLSPLWAGVACVFPMVAHEMVTRARNAPLTFHIPYLEDENVEEDIVRLALSKITQIRSLRIGSWRDPLDSKYQRDIEDALTNRPLPLLEEARLHVYPPSSPIFTPEILSTSPARGQLDMSPKLQAPALRAYAHRNLFTFSCPMLTSLETTDSVDIQSSPCYLLDILRGFPLLETTRLHLTCGPDSRPQGAFVPVETERTSPWSTCLEPPVVLEHLRSVSFSVNSPTADVLGLWCCIQAPANCNVSLSGFDLVVSIEPACRALGEQLQNPALDTLVVKCPGRSGAGVGLRSSHSTRNTASRHSVNLTSGSGETDYSQMPAIVASLVSAVQTQNIQHLNLLKVKNYWVYGYDNNEMQRALEPLSSVEVVSVHGDFGISGILCMMNAFENGPKPLFPKLNTLVVHMRMKPYEFEDWHADCWQAIAELLDHRKRADVPVRELRITGGWRSEKLRQDWFGAEGPHLAKVRSAVEVVRDERTVKYYEEGCDCCDTDLEGESDDENQET